MMKRKVGNVLLLLFITIVVLNACKSKRLFQHTVIGEGLTTSGQSGHVIDSIRQFQFRFKNLEAQFVTQFQSSKNSMKLGGQLKMTKDSIIWLSISPGMGIEAARAQLTPDSVFIINRLQSSYYKGNYSQLDSLFKISLSFHVIQSILTDRLFAYPETNDEVKVLKKYNLAENKEQFAISSDSTDGSFRQNILVRKSDYAILQNSIRDIKNGRNMIINYLSFIQQNGSSFPESYNVEVVTSKDSVKVAMEYSKIEMPVDINYSFKISKKYKQITSFSMKK